MHLCHLFLSATALNYGKCCRCGSRLTWKRPQSGLQEGRREQCRPHRHLIPENAAVAERVNPWKCCHCGEGFGKGLSQPMKSGEAGALLCGFRSDAMPGRWDMMPRRYLRDDVLPQNGCTSIFGQNQNSLLILPFLNQVTRIWQKRKKKRRIPR